MAISKIVWVGEVRREFVWVRDPDASEYQRPCEGCDGYCELSRSEDEATRELGEIYQQQYCCGRTLVRQTVRWRASIPYRRDRSSSPDSASWTGDEEEECVTRAWAKIAAMRLDDDEGDP